MGKKDNKKITGVEMKFSLSMDDFKLISTAALEKGMSAGDLVKQAIAQLVDDIKNPGGLILFEKHKREKRGQNIYNFKQNQDDGDNK